MIRVLTLATVVWLEVLRRKDVYVLFILLAAFLLTLLGLDAFGLGEQSGYLKEIGLLLAWLFAWIMATAVSVRQLPQEERQGTIFALLAKPVGRGELILGKWLGAWSVVGAATAVFYLLLGLLAAWLGAGFDAVVLVQALVLHLALLGVLAALGLACATRLHADAAAALSLIISLAAFLVLPRIPSLVMAERGLRQNLLLALYYLLPHLELFDMRRRLAHGWEPVGAGALLQVMLYGAALAAIGLLAARMLYRRKLFVRGRML